MSLVQAAHSPVSSPPIDRVNDDLLSMIFLLACQPPMWHTEPEWIGNLTLTFVCRRWRHHALSLATLWATLSWEAGMHAAHALAILERSAAADITVSIRLAAHHSRTFRQLSAADTADGHAVVRAIAQKAHLERTIQLSLQLTAVAWDEDVFAPFLRQGEPLPMPSLRSLSIFTWDSEELASARPIRIRAFDLEQITIESCNVWAWGVFAGARTTHVSIGGFTLKMSDLATLLEFAPNLDRLNIGSVFRPTHIHNDISPEAVIRRSLSTHPHAGSRLTHLDAVGIVAPGLALLCQILPTQLCVPNIALFQTAPIVDDDDDDDDWLKFLMIPRIASVSEEIDISAHASFTLRSADGTKKRTFTCTTGHIGDTTILHSLVNAHLPMWDTVQTLTIGILQWSALFDPLREAGVTQMGALQSLTINVDQREVEGHFLEIEEDDSAWLKFPVLEKVHIVVWGSNSAAEPTFELVLMLIRALVTIGAIWMLGGVLDLRAPPGLKRRSSDMRTAFRERCKEIAEDQEDAEDGPTAVSLVARRLSLLP